MQYRKTWRVCETPMEDVVHLEDRGMTGMLFLGVVSRHVYLCLDPDRAKGSAPTWTMLILEPIP